MFTDVQMMELYFLSSNVCVFFPFFRMRSCSMTKLSSDALAEMISSASCQLKVLDLSDNDLEDEGVTVFSTGLGNSCCKLETLR